MNIDLTMLPRRSLLVWAATASAAAARAQGNRPVRRVGFSHTKDPVSFLLPGVLAEALAARGWEVGRNLILDARAFDFRDTVGLERNTRELVASGCEVIVTATDAGAAVLRRWAAETPIVFFYGLDPVGLGVVQSLARPGGHTTGYSVSDRELGPKRISILKELIPRLQRIAILYPKTDDGGPGRVAAASLAAVAQALGVQSIGMGYEERNLAAAYMEMARLGVQATLSVPSRLVLLVKEELAALAMKHHIPGIFGASEFADAGALVSYGVSFSAACGRAAVLVDRILRGVRPADIPIEQVGAYEFVLNLRAAHALGIRVPQSTLLQVTRVIGV